MAKTWNPKSGEYEDYVPRVRTYPPLPAALAAQAASIPTTTDMGVVYCPCRATLRDGRVIDCVYLVEATAYFGVWGVGPDEDRAKQEIAVEDVVGIEESPYRLPAVFAQKLYDAGESGMGYTVYEIEYRDGERTAHIGGNAVDFVMLPVGMTMADIVAVHPHEGRDRHPWNTPGYFWCLYSKP